MTTDTAQIRGKTHGPLTQAGDSHPSDSWMLYAAEQLQSPSPVEAFSNFKPSAATGHSSQKGISLPVDYIVKRVKYCMGVEEVLAHVSLAKLNNISKRLEELLIQSEAQQDNTAVSLESFRDFALFFIPNQNLKTPLIGVTNDGLIQAEWHLGRKRHIVLKFLGNRANRLAIIKPLPGGRLRKKSYLIQLPLSEIYTELSDQRVISWLKA